ncbi:MAG: transposase [Gemmatimonadota bacterium]|nr:transposase [Gemmatimonadota bacterium]
MQTQVDHMSIDEIFSHYLGRGFDYVRSGRETEALSDRRLAALGVQRVLEQHVSGREFLQSVREVDDTELARTTFFEALNSYRRCRMLGELSAGLRQVADRDLAGCGVDYLSDIPELAGWRVLAGDGHSIEHGCHAQKSADGAHLPSTVLFLQSLRTGIIQAFCPVVGAGRHQHEWPAFKSALPLLDGPDLTGQLLKTLFILDRAYIDNLFWAKQKHLLVITRSKSNFKPVSSRALPFDADDPVNVGVVAYRELDFASGAVLREVSYVDPETGEAYKFLTTCTKLKPGLIAHLYRLRWRIEKTFDVLKNVLGETKAWTASEAGQMSQAHLIAIAYNLCVLLQSILAANHGLRDTKVEAKHDQWVARREKLAAARGRRLHPLELTLPRMPRLSAQFIRTIRNHLHLPATLLALLPAFTATLAHYL